MILLEAAPTAFQNIGYKFWIILICLTLIYAVLVYFFLPETKGMTLEDISVLFGDPVELSFEQALHKEGVRGEGELMEVLEKENHHGEHVEATVGTVDRNESLHRAAEDAKV